MENKFNDPTVISIPPEPKCRRSIKSELPKGSYYLNNNSHELHMEHKISRRRQKLNLSENETSDDNIDNDKQMSSSDEQDEKVQFLHLRNRSRTISPEKFFSTEEELQSQKGITKKNSQSKIDANNFFHLWVLIIIVISLVLFSLYPSKNEKQKQPINNSNSLLFESIENVKTKFYNQELGIWNDIASAINEVMTRNPKIPSIILLFANETTTMDCLATDLAHASSTVLHTDSPLYLTPENFGDDAGEIINTLNEYSPPKKVVVIRDILGINVEAIRALHNLCDRINPLIKEAIYILTMQTKTYQSSQKKLAFVEEQIYYKLSKNIDQDVLMALVTRITDGAIILVQPEPQLRYC